MAEVLPANQLINMLHNLHFDHNLVLQSLWFAHAARHGVFYARVLTEELLTQEANFPSILLHPAFVQLYMLLKYGWIV